jgi:hypothetical protein
MQLRMHGPQSSATDPPRDVGEIITGTKLTRKPAATESPGLFGGAPMIRLDPASGKAGAR